MWTATSAVIISLLTVSSAFAADTTRTLSPGKPAGVHQAQMFDNISPIVYFGVIAIGLGIAYAVTHDNNNNTTTPAANGGGTTVTTTGTA